jgi:hypothetical protein
MDDASTLALIFVGVCAIVTFMCCVVLIFHPDYNDGLLGRLGMSLIAVVAATRVFKLFDLHQYDWVSSNLVIIWAGVALFFSQHAYSFLHRAKWKGPHWYYRRGSSGKRIND